MNEQETIALAEALKALLEYRSITQRILSKYPAYVKASDRKQLIDLNRAVEQSLNVLTTEQK